MSYDHKWTMEFYTTTISHKSSLRASAIIILITYVALFNETLHLLYRYMYVCAYVYICIYILNCSEVVWKKKND